MGRSKLNHTRHHAVLITCILAEFWVRIDQKLSCNKCCMISCILLKLPKDIKYVINHQAI